MAGPAAVEELSLAEQIRQPITEEDAAKAIRKGHLRSMLAQVMLLSDDEWAELLGMARAAGRRVA